jgi:SAM-dependent methyltransferase
MVSMRRTYFDEMYGSDPDPWQFESSRYEERKYALTLAALPDRRYRSAFEPGCSIGVLTSLLAERCDELLATDILPGVVERARERCHALANVRCELRPIPEEWPSEPFELIVLSEIAYYFDRATLEAMMSQALATCSPMATVVGVHWRGATNYPLSGDEAHEIIGSHSSLRHRASYVESDFLLDVWIRADEHTRVELSPDDRLQ